MIEKNKRILVIDDDREIWKAYKLILEPESLRNGSAREKMDVLLGSEQDMESSLSFDVTYADQGIEGFNNAKAARSENIPFAVAFIDVRMPPGWNGMETAFRIRQIDPNIEIVIVTAYSDQSCDDIVRKVGSPEKILFIRKPFDPEELKQLAVSLTEKWNISQREKAQHLELQEKIAALKQLQQEQQDLQKKLLQAQKMEAIGLMAGGVAHDLNNILSGLISYPELMLMMLPKESELRGYLETMKKAGLRASAVVADMLTVARGVTIVREPGEINKLIHDYFFSPEGERLQSIYPEIDFTLQLTPMDVVISCSPVHINKCLMNLVTNAAEAINGPGTVRISTELVKRAGNGEDYAKICVADTGPGIPTKDIEHIFEPFYSKKKLGRSGTGLGLAVVWNCVQNHEGTIDVESSNKGTVFTIKFPLTDNLPSPQKEEIDVLQKLQGQGSVLIIDDEEQQRDIALNLLTMLGYTTKAVAGGEEAVTYLKEESVDLVLVDMIMDPGMNGCMTYEQILKIHPQQKAIIVSGFSENREVQQTMALGAGTFIRKPYTLEQLGKAVQTILAQ